MRIDVLRRRRSVRGIRSVAGWPPRGSLFPGSLPGLRDGSAMLSASWLVAAASPYPDRLVSDRARSVGRPEWVGTVAEPRLGPR